MPAAAPTPGPSLVADCSIVELAPAVIDPETGNVLVPPVLQLPAVIEVTLTGAALTQWHADQDAHTQKLAADAATATATAWVELRMIRDRWLAQTDYVESYLNSPATFQHLPQPIKDAVTKNAAAWTAWRQALRDLPALPGTPGLDPVAAVASVADVHATTDAFPAPWPQPPTAPVIHLT